jgi:hypothetical protein
MPSSSPPTDTGYALPLLAASKSSTWRASALGCSPYPGGYTDVCDILRSIVDELKPERSDTSKVKEPECVSIAWSADGQTLFGGFTDELVRVWSVIS